ncbi:MAG TPA: hypothetical protein VFR78_02250 [Pyrinomonadaceae bacterium]|nr:hypothetical protein [Pyrinomonadaceae bacterium]
MLTRIHFLLCTSLICFAATTALAQTSVTELQKLLREKAAFDDTDFAALQQNQPAVKLVPGSDKREVAVTGLVNVHTSAEHFLKSYRESMTKKNNSAILEIGSLGNAPALADVESLTLEPRDIEDLKECIAGDCQVKLSAPMIERFRKDVDWNAPDYALQATNLFKQMLVDYVRDYRSRGDAALLQYNDKREAVSLAAEQRALATASGYVNDVLNGERSKLQVVEDAIVWSKIKFGLKPVIAVNHITIYRRDREVGPQVLIAAKQIYANHYFNGSLALTAFVKIPEGSYLVYENRSRADGLEGPFGKLKRGVVEKKAVAGLKTILEHSRTSFDPTALAATAQFSSHQSIGWGQRLFGGIRPLLWLLVLSALIALLVLGSSTARKNKALKPEGAKS